MSSTEPKRYFGAPLYSWVVVGMLWWISVFNYADRQAIVAMFPLLKRDMGLTDQEKGVLGSAFGIVYGLGAPFAGLIIDRVSRKTAILGGLHIWSLICMATALSRNLRHLIFFRAAEGLGETFYYPASTSLMSDYHGKETRSRALGIHQTSVYIGTIAGGYFAGLIAQEFDSWKASCVIFGALGMVLGFILHFYLREPVRGAAEEEAAAVTAASRMPPMQTLALIFRTPVAVLLMFAFLFVNSAAAVLLIWMPDFLYEKFALNLAGAAFVATAFSQLPSMLGAFLGGWLADILRIRTRRGRILVQVLAVLAAAPFVVITGQASALSGIYIGLIGWGLFKGFYDANIFASVFDVIPPHARGSVAGFMNMFAWLGGGALGPIVVGYLSPHIGKGSAISLSALGYVIGLCFLIPACLLIRPNPSHAQSGTVTP